MPRETYKSRNIIISSALESQSLIHKFPAAIAETEAKHLFIASKQGMLE